MIQPSNIIRGVWQQPPSSAASWAARGCNAFVDLQQGQTWKATVDACAAAGIKAIIGPLGDNFANLSIDDLYAPGFFGVLQKPDEPENQEHIPTTDATGRKDYLKAAQTWKYRYDVLKAAAPNVPIFGNFNGMILTAARESWAGTGKPPAEQNITLPEYSAFMAGCDWIGADWHVRNSGRGPDKIIDLYTKMIGRLQTQSGGKPSMAVIECAYEHRPENGPGPSAAEIRAQVWASLILGAVGVIYFPAKIGGGYVADNMSAEQSAAVAQCNDEIRRAEPWLLKGTRDFRQAVASGISATWKLPDGSFLGANVLWNGVAGQFVIGVDIPSIPAPDPEKEAMRARLKRIDDWVKAFPAN